MRKRLNIQAGQCWEPESDSVPKRTIIELGKDGWGTPYIYYNRDGSTERLACGYPGWRKWVRKYNAKVVSIRKMA